VSVSPNVTGNSKLPRGAVTMGAKAEGIPDLAWILRPGDRGGVDEGGLGSNPFHQGIAKESGDPDVVAAAMSKPDVVLRLPAGSEGPYREHADPADGLVMGPSTHQRRAGRNQRSKGRQAFSWATSQAVL
jgi:colicin import membrane protein